MNRSFLIAKLEEEGFSKIVVDAFRRVPREKFVKSEFLDSAYDDIALPLVEGSTISQPFTIGIMLELLDLKNDMNILEIGSGSGYLIGLINEISKNSEIFGIERIKSLADSSFDYYKYEDNIKIIYGDGKKGLEDYAPFDRIIVSADFLETPHHLLSQLTHNGTIVVPVKDSIVKIEKKDGILKETNYPGFLFVPIK